MCKTNTPLEFYEDLNLWVKREDKCCPGGPNFSKTRGVYAHVKARPEKIIGVLDTSHSQGGWAVAKACRLLKKHCVHFFPLTKKNANRPWVEVLRDHPQWEEAARQMAVPTALQAGRSAILYHQAKKWLIGYRDGKGYMMPNALKLHESVTETAAEFDRTQIPNSVDKIIVSASSGTIAAGVVLGARRAGWDGTIIIHMGYARSYGAVKSYIERMAGHSLGKHEFVDEGYDYADSAQPGLDPPFPCNEYYDLKAFRWFTKTIHATKGNPSLLWNIG